MLTAAQAREIKNVADLMTTLDPLIRAEAAKGNKGITIPNDSKTHTVGSTEPEMSTLLKMLCEELKKLGFTYSWKAMGPYAHPAMGFQTWDTDTPLEREAEFKLTIYW